MGKQINYWMGYKDFLQVAQTALDCGCTIIKSVNGKLQYGNTIEFITEEEKCYYFYLPEAGELKVEKVNGREHIGGYSASGNVIIEAAFSYRDDNRKEIMRSRLFVTTGYYNSEEAFIDRPECLTKVYNKLVRTVKKVAPYTELVDYYTSRNDSDYLQKKEWKHKEYVTPEYMELKITKGYKLI